jgi:hypothetical protein
MSFLNSAAGASGQPLGNLIGADPSRISSIANSIGTGMNGIAAAGGAAPGYNAPGHAPGAHPLLRPLLRTTTCNCSIRTSFKR